VHVEEGLALFEDKVMIAEYDFNQVVNLQDRYGVNVLENVQENTAAFNSRCAP